MDAILKETLRVMKNEHPEYEEFIRTINSFIASGQRNKWIGRNGWNIYVRHSKRFINSICGDCLDIANITIERREIDTFLWVLKAAINVAKSQGITFIRVENILNNELIPLFNRNGWRFEKNSCELSPCYYMVLNDCEASI